MYYLYLDTKIKGTYDIVFSYFQNGIFDKENIVILHKHYKVNAKWAQVFQKNNIKTLHIKRWKDLPPLKDTTILYMFNAQSNCRVVAYREATHIFIGHGESNKLSSAKPIFRIYDYIAVAGQANIDRFIEQKIFTQCDEKNNKFIKVGNKFIANSKYFYKADAQTLLYAPTWEGGLEEENYSSIEKDLKSFHYICKYAQENNIKQIIIQPHPNTGHRIAAYKKYLYNGIKLLKKANLNVMLKGKPSSLWSRFLLKQHFINNESELAISIAFCDISAMEIQLLNKDIPTFIFQNQTQAIRPSSPLLKQYYKLKIIDYNNTHLIFDVNLHKKVKKYYLEENSVNIMKEIPQ